jgi:hypothetical protein
MIDRHPRVEDRVDYQRFLEDIRAMRPPFAKRQRTMTQKEKDDVGLSASSGSGVDRSPYAHRLTLPGLPVFVSAVCGTMHLAWHYLLYREGSNLMAAGSDGLSSTVTTIAAETGHVVEEVSRSTQESVTSLGELVNWALFWAKVLLAAAAMQEVTRHRFTRRLLRGFKVWFPWISRCLGLGSSVSLGKQFSSNNAGDGPQSPLADDDFATIAHARVRDVLSDEGDNTLFDDAEYESWPVVQVTGTALDDWHDYVGRRLAFSYSRGSRPGFVRTVVVLKAGPGRLTGDDAGAVKTYYTQYTSRVRAEPHGEQLMVQDSPKSDVKAELAVEPRTLNFQGEVCKGVSVPDSGRSASLATAGGNPYSALTDMGATLGAVRVEDRSIQCYRTEQFSAYPEIQVMYHPNIVPFLLYGLGSVSAFR